MGEMELGAVQARFADLVWRHEPVASGELVKICERVVRDMGREDKAAYAQALLDCSFPRRMIRVCPLAFGEVGVKDRVKAVLNYKRPVFWVSLAAVIVCAAAAVCFLTDPKVQAGEPWPESLPDTFHFLSGAGGWSTELYLSKEGSFTGLYQDGAASFDPVEYPNGTTYICEFTGSFSQPVKVEELVYSAQVQSLAYEEPEKVTIEDGMRYITSVPYGLENAGEVRIYLPGYPLADLPEEIQFWVKNAREYWDGNGPDNLPFYVLHNVEEGLAFFSDGYLPLYGD